MATNPETKYPDTYLHVEHCQSAETWVHPIRGNGTLDLETQVRRWLKRQFSGELKLSGKLMPRLQGEYYARIMTDGRPPESVVCWQSAGFFTETTY